MGGLFPPVMRGFSSDGKLPPVIRALASATLASMPAVSTARVSILRMSKLAACFQAARVEHWSRLAFRSGSGHCHVFKDFKGIHGTHDHARDHFDSAGR